MQGFEGLIANSGAGAINAINEEYLQSVDDMFDRLREQAAVQSDPDYLDFQHEKKEKEVESSISQDSRDYQRLAFSSTAERDKFIKTMHDMGATVIVAPEKLSDQYLVEVQRDFSLDRLDQNSDFVQQAKEHGYKSVSLESVLQYHEISAEAQNKPSKITEYTTEDVYDDTLKRKLVAHLDTLGEALDLIERVTMAGDVVQSEKQAVRDGHTRQDGSLRIGSAHRSVATVINDEIVLINGRQVTGKAAEEILKRHEERKNLASVVEGVTDDRQDRLDRRNEKGKNKAEEWNSHIHEVKQVGRGVASGVGAGTIAAAGVVGMSVATGGLGGLAAAGVAAASGAAAHKAGKALSSEHKVFRADVNNENAQEEIREMLKKEGMTEAQAKIQKKDGEVTRITYRADDGKTVTVLHEHKDAKVRTAHLKPIQANAQAIQKTVYKQEYVVEGRYESSEFFKDMRLSAESADVLMSMLIARPEMFSQEQINAIREFSLRGEASNLSRDERRNFVRMIEEVKKSEEWTKDEIEAIKEAQKEIQLSAYELRDEEEEKKNKNNWLDTNVKLDFGLGEIEAIAVALNADFYIAAAEKTFEFNRDMVRVKADTENGVNFINDAMKHGGRAGLSNEHFNVLKKVEESTNRGVTVTLTAEERYYLDDALKGYERVRGNALSIDDKAKIRDFTDKFALQSHERSSVMNMVSIKKDLGISITSANFTPEKVLEINKAFLEKANGAGLNLLKRKGLRGWEIDTEKLGMLTAEHLERMGGMSANTISLIKRVNEAQITQGVMSPDNLINKRKVISMFMKMDDNESLAEFQNMTSKVRSGVQYVQAGVVKLENERQAMRAKRDAKKANKSNYGKGGSGKRKKQSKPKKPKKDKAEKLLYGAADAEKMAARTAKAAATKDKAAKAAIRRENSLLGKGMKNAATITNRIGQMKAVKAVNALKKAAGKLLGKLALYLGGGVLVFGGAVAIIIVVISSISAFLDAINPINIINNALAPDTYADTVAYRMYDEYLKLSEQDWIKDEVGNFKEMYDERNHLSYGSDYEGFQSYVGHFPNLVLLDDDGNHYYSDLYINPFWKDNTPNVGGVGTSVTDAGTTSITTYDGTYNKSILSKGWNSSTGYYDGTQTMTFGANNNAFSKSLVDESLDYGYASVESGHTSNLKDILCMVDVMYSNDLNDVVNGDKMSESILGKSPEQVTFDDAVDNVKGFFKWLWNTIKAPFTDAKYEPLKNFCNDNVSYSTVVKYAQTVFENSHQQEVSLNVEYHNYTPVVLQSESGGAFDVTDMLNQVGASTIGYCNTPTKTKFELFWNTSGGTSRVSPYFWKNGDESTGVKYATDTKNYDGTNRYEVWVDYSNIDDPDTACLKNSMGSDEATYTYIKNLKDTLGILSCWQQTVNKEEKQAWTDTADSTGGTGYYKRVAHNETSSDFVWVDGTDGYYTSSNDAKNSAKDNLQVKYDNRVVPDDSFVLSGDRNTFTRTFYEKPAFNPTYEDYEVKERITGWHEDEEIQYWWWSEATGTGITTVDKGHGKDWCVRKWLSQTEATDEWYATGFRTEADAEAWVSSHSDQITTGWYSVCQKFTRKDILVPDYSYFYKKKATTTTLKRFEDKFERDCNGHNFKYCGGHIAVHSHGVVFSFTNEQIDMLEMRDEESGLPLVDGYDLGANGFESIRGKVIKKEVDYSTAESAASSGGCTSPVLDPQGSISGMYGLNLNVSSGSWASGYDLRFSNGFHLMRDIFDIDTVVLKGDNIFPLSLDYKKFEGWTDDNITLALLKFSNDWYEVYGFDIPQEICTGVLGTTNGDGTVAPYDYGYDGAGQAALSQDDINNIVEALRANTDYAGHFSDDREKAVRTALGFVGRGHYNPYHHHDFLAEPCAGLGYNWTDSFGNTGYVNYSGNCTAGDEISFTNYILRHFGKSAITSEAGAGFAYSYSSSAQTSNAYPADIVSHISAGNLLDTPVDTSDFSLTDLWLGNYGVWKLKEQVRYRSVVFIGIIKSDLQLSTGQIIKAGVPITVDLSIAADGKNYNVGNIYLHGANTGEDKISFNQYSWIMDDTSRTRVKRFE